MSKFRKRPVVIEAFQMTEESGLNLPGTTWPDWLQRAWNGERSKVGSMYPTTVGTDGSASHAMSICTLGGEMKVSWDDWIIQGVGGELYPCKPDIFEKTYESIEEEIATWWNRRRN